MAGIVFKNISVVAGYRQFCGLYFRPYVRERGEGDVGVDAYEWGTNASESYWMGIAGPVA